MEQCRLIKELPEWVCRDLRHVFCLGDVADCEAVDYSEKIIVYIDKNNCHYILNIPKDVFYECFEEIKERKVWDREKEHEYMNSVVVNGKTYTYPEGSNSIVIKDGQIIVDGKVLADCDNNANVTINGNIENLKCRGSVTVNGNVEEINCGESCNISGNVSGDIDAEGSVSCRDVTGNIDTGGSVNCKKWRIIK